MDFYVPGPALDALKVALKQNRQGPGHPGGYMPLT